LTSEREYRQPPAIPSISISFPVRDHAFRRDQRIFLPGKTMDCDSVSFDTFPCAFEALPNSWKLTWHFGHRVGLKTIQITVSCARCEFRGYTRSRSLRGYDHVYTCINEQGGTLKKLQRPQPHSIGSRTVAVRRRLFGNPVPELRVKVHRNAVNTVLYSFLFKFDSLEIRARRSCVHMVSTVLTTKSPNGDGGASCSTSRIRDSYGVLPISDAAWAI